MSTFEERATARLTPSDRPDWQQLAEERAEIVRTLQKSVDDLGAAEWKIQKEADRKKEAVRLKYRSINEALAKRNLELLIMLYPHIDD